MNPRRIRLASFTLLLALQLVLASSVLADDPAPAQTPARPGKVKTDDGPTSLTYGPILYDPSGNIAAIGASYYVYDQTSRVTAASVEDAGYLQAQTYTYDPYGNRTGDGTTTYSVNTANNRLTSHGAAYDTRGNLTSWQPPGSAVARNYTWDAMNNLVHEQLGTDDAVSYHHVYTAEDERLWTLVGSRNPSCPDGVCSESRWTLRDLEGRVLREFTENGTWSHRDYVYRNGQLLASIRLSDTEHYSLDHLGTPRIVTNQDAEKIGDHAYFPFGAEITPDPSADARLRFTGHERRDADMAGETLGQLDYMHARYYAGGMGRFLSIDPKLDVDLSAKNPQRWNRYAYALGNPVVLKDPDGRDVDIFIVDPAAGTSYWGHAALFVPRSSLGSRGVSYGGDYVFKANDANAVRAFVEGYTRGSHRGVTSYTLKTTPEQDALMVSFLKANPNGGIDTDGLFSSLMVRQNCTTSVLNTLQAGGVIGDGVDANNWFGATLPSKLQELLENGELGFVTNRIRYPAPRQMNVSGFGDPFSFQGALIDGVWQSYAFTSR